MPLLGFVHGRGPARNNSADRTSIKEHLRKVATKGPSTISVQPGLFGNVDDNWSHPFMNTKRHSSLAAKLGERRSSGTSPKIQFHKAARLWLSVESPPLTSYNIPANSSGALFSAQLHVDVAEGEVTLNSVTVRIICATTVKKPVHTGCQDCTTKIAELKKIELAKDVLKLKQGDHPIPFSYLFQGHLPATTKASLVHLEYFILAEAKTSTGETIHLTQRGPNGETVPLPENRYAVKLMRSIFPGNDKHSIRVFPPTNLTANVHYKLVIHPIGESKVEMRISGMTSKTSTQINRWALKKLTWRIEEIRKMISPACPKHAAKAGGLGNGISHEEVKVVGESEVNKDREPWKTDYEAGDVDSEFMIAINPNRGAACDAIAPNGMSVSHKLVIELVVAEEWAPKSKPKSFTPTGAARILRAVFDLTLTERPGLGVPWDEETPPVYEDVPESPPHYANMVDLGLNAIGGQIEELTLDPDTGAVQTAESSSSARSMSGPSSSSAHQPFGRPRFSADDLLSGPPERAQPENQEEEEDDVQVGDAGQPPARRP